MKVLIFTECLAGGVCSVISDQIQYLSAEDKQLQFDLLYSKKDETPKDLAQRFPDVGLIEIPYERGERFFLVKVFCYLLFRVKTKNYSVIHLHSSFSGFLGRIAFGLSAHKLCYTPHCFAFLSEEFSPLKQKVFYWIEKRLSLIGCIVACGGSEAKLAKGFSTKVRVHTISNGVNFSDLTSSVTSSQADIISVGRICKQKGFDDFKALYALASHQYSLVWLGGPKPDGIDYVSGWLSREALFQYYSSARLYVSTAHWEGMPVAPIEAQYFGLPVVAIRTHGVVDCVVDGETGYLCDSIEELYQRCQQLLSDASEYQRLSHNAKAHIRKHFSLANYAGLLSLYRQIAADTLALSEQTLS
ncbi:glycosyltransferase [Agarivorans sp. QJM3NY_29]|uniref:glycosyltransferase n=1 Tax=unclassified Agarivorans TaxID=2636026 RepID=UPI003D7E8470